MKKLDHIHAAHCAHDMSEAVFCWVTSGAAARFYKNSSTSLVSAAVTAPVSAATDCEPERPGPRAILAMHRHAWWEADFNRSARVGTRVRSTLPQNQQAAQNGELAVADVILYHIIPFNHVNHITSCRPEPAARLFVLNSLDILTDSKPVDVCGEKLDGRACADTLSRARPVAELPVSAVNT